MLQEIFTESCKAMLNILRNPEGVSAADLNAIRGFLKDSGVNAIPVPGSPLGDLVEEVRKQAEYPFAVPGDILEVDDPVVTRKKVDPA